MVRTENCVNGASRLWCSCKYVSGRYRHIHIWNDPRPSIHLLFNVFSPYWVGRTIGIQNALIPFNCDVNDQIESNFVLIVKLIYFVFFHKNYFVTLYWASHCFRDRRHTNSCITVISEELRAAQWGPWRWSIMGLKQECHQQCLQRHPTHPTNAGGTHCLCTHPCMQEFWKPSPPEMKQISVLGHCHASWQRDVHIALSWSGPALFFLLFSM